MIRYSARTSIRSTLLKWFLLNSVLCRSLLAMIFVVVVIADPADAAPRFVPSGFRIYYGGDREKSSELVDQLRTGQIIVIDTRAMKPETLRQLIIESNHVGAKVLGYISIGELEDYRVEHFLKDLQVRQGHTSTDQSALDSITLSRNDKFKSLQIDVRSNAWQSYVKTMVDGIYRQGVHGVFLDTVDTVDLSISRRQWSIERRVESVRAMMALVRSIKAKDRRKYILQNRGLNLIGPTVFVGDATGVEIPGLSLEQPHRDNPDGILWENAFAHQDEWTIAKRDQLLAIQRSREADVFTLGYKESLDNADDFFRKSLASQFIPAWASSSETLHKELTKLPEVRRQ